MTILESTPALRTSGYEMRLLHVPSGVKHEVQGEKIIACLLRGSVVSEPRLPFRESRVVEKGFSLRAGDTGCLLFVCVDEGDVDEGDNGKYMDQVRGLDISWSEYDGNMYKTLPQIHVDEYRINLWYLGPKKRGGIHNHADEQVQFVEFHTQLRGGGWMVRYDRGKGKRGPEFVRRDRIKMPIGYTHPLFCSLEGGIPVYPWHEYIADKRGSLFVVFEDTRIPDEL